MIPIPETITYTFKVQEEAQHVIAAMLGIDAPTLTRNQIQDHLNR